MTGRLAMLNRVLKAPVSINMPPVILNRWRAIYHSAQAPQQPSLGCLPFAQPNRMVHSTPSRHRFSLAERIKQLLPDEALEKPPSESTEDSHFDPDFEEPEIDTLLAAYEAEVSAAISMIKRHDFNAAATYLLENMPLASVMSAFTVRIIPLLETSPLKRLAVAEFAYSFYEQGHESLLGHLMQEKGPTILSDLELREFRFIQTLGLSTQSPALSTAQMDAFTRTGAQLYFPQLLSNPSCSAWFKARLLSHLTDDDLNRWIVKYAKHLDGESIVLLALYAGGSSNDRFKQVVNFVLAKPEGERNRCLEPLLRIISSPDQFRFISRKLLRAAVTVPSEVVVAWLESGIRLKQSYDIANICKYCSSALKAPEHHALLAKALLAAAFAQRRHEQDTDGPPSRKIVAVPNDQLQTFLVKRVLTPVLENCEARNAVISRAASRLYVLHKRKVPGMVLWQLLMSLPGPLNGTANASLAKLIVTRPYIEQIRYMSLPSVTVGSISQVLKWHITKIMEYRRVNGVPPEALQAKDDIQLLVVGMLLASEKQATKMQAEVALSSAVTQLFESDVEPALDASIASIASTSHDREMSASIALYVIAELVKQKSYTVAKQLFTTIGPNRLLPTVLDKLLLNLAQGQPEDSHHFVTWLVKSTKAPVRPQCINKMLVILSQSNKLTESQLINRFQALRDLLRERLKSNCNQEASKALVDALITSAYSRGRGSHLRLKWALGVAKSCKVPQCEFNRWNSLLEKMRDEQRGYWSGQ